MEAIRQSLSSVGRDRIFKWVVDLVRGYVQLGGQLLAVQQDGQVRWARGIAILANEDGKIDEIKYVSEPTRAPASKCKGKNRSS